MMDTNNRMTESNAESNQTITKTRKMAKRQVKNPLLVDYKTDQER